MLAEQVYSKEMIDEFSEFIKSFDSEYGAEMANCNLDGYDLLVELRGITKGEEVIPAIKNFYNETADELEACFPEAFDSLYDVLVKYNLAEN